MFQKALILALLLAAETHSQTAGDAHALLEKARSTGFTPLARDDAEAALLQAIDTWSKLNLADDPEYAQALVLLGILRAAKHEDTRTAVEPLYSEAIDIYDRIFNSSDPAAVALALELDSEALEQIGALGKSAPLRRRAMGIRTKLVDELLKNAPDPPPGQIRVASDVVLMAPRPDDAANRFVNEFRESKTAPGSVKGAVQSWVETPPEVLASAEPVIDEFTRLIKPQGTVYFTLVVGMDGRPYRIHLNRSAGFGLDERCLAALENWRFAPGKDFQGQAMNVQATVQFNFHVPY